MFFRKKEELNPRYEFSFNYLPKTFFQNGELFYEELEKRKNDFIYQLMSQCYQEMKTDRDIWNKENIIVSSIDADNVEAIWIQHSYIDEFIHSEGRFSRTQFDEDTGHMYFDLPRCVAFVFVKHKSEKGKVVYQMFAVSRNDALDSFTLICFKKPKKKSSTQDFIMLKELTYLYSNADKYYVVSEIEKFMNEKYCKNFAKANGYNKNFLDETIA